MSNGIKELGNVAKGGVMGAGIGTLVGYSVDQTNGLSRMATVDILSHNINLPYGPAEIALAVVFGFIGGALGPMIFESVGQSRRSKAPRTPRG